MYVTDEQNTKVQIIHAILVARLAQSVEHETLNLRVVGSSPTLGVVFYPIISVVVRYRASSNIINTISYFCQPG